MIVLSYLSLDCQGVGVMSHHLDLVQELLHVAQGSAEQHAASELF